jgi:hypothetical protein
LTLHPTPRGAEALLKELRQRKKELQLEKREISAKMSQVRAEARQRSASAGNTWLGYDSKKAAYERRGIRYAKKPLCSPTKILNLLLNVKLPKLSDIIWPKDLLSR